MDDYIGAEVPPLAKVFELCVETLFRILGWETSADKDQPFGPISIALGIELDTTEAKTGFVYLRNSSKRKQELIDLISDILSRGLLTSKERQRLRGRIQFASNQVAGKRAGLAYKALSRHLVSGDPRVGGDLQRSLLFLRDNFLEGPPRTLCSNMLHLWHMYVDASHDGDRVGLGGVLISGSGCKVACFSVWACDELRSLISPNSGNPIFEYECLAILLGLCTWSGLIRGCNVVVFSDNQGTLGAMISGSSDNECGALIVNRTHDLLDTMCVNAWFERVNTASNIADPPSKLLGSSLFCSVCVGGRVGASLTVPLCRGKTAAICHCAPADFFRYPVAFLQPFLNFMGATWKKTRNPTAFFLMMMMIANGILMWTTRQSRSLRKASGYILADSFFGKPSCSSSQWTSLRQAREPNRRAESYAGPKGCSSLEALGTAAKLFGPCCRRPDHACYPACCGNITGSSAMTYWRMTWFSKIYGGPSQQMSSSDWLTMTA